MKTHFKRLLLITLLFITPCYALHLSVSRLYLGVQAGYTSANYTNSNLAAGFPATSISKSGIAARLYLGYTFTRYLGAQFSVIWFHKPQFKGIPGNTSITIKNNLVFLAGKLNWPVCPHFNIYGLGGIGYVVRSGIVSGTSVVLKNNEIVRPVYGLGADWNFYHRWYLDGTWVQAAPKSGEQLPTSNYFGIGVFYMF